MKILIINGPNLNMLGKRDPDQYGALTLQQINDMLSDKAEKEQIVLHFFQSNHEGALIDFLQKEADLADGILINPGALTHYGYALRDALVDTRLPIMEVHLSDISSREEFRKIDVLEGVAITVVKGLKEHSYLEGLDQLVSFISTKESRIV